MRMEVMCRSFKSQCLIQSPSFPLCHYNQPSSRWQMLHLSGSWRDSNVEQSPQLTSHGQEAWTRNRTLFKPPRLWGDLYCSLTWLTLAVLCCRPNTPSLLFILQAPELFSTWDFCDAHSFRVLLIRVSSSRGELLTYQIQVLGFDF